MLTEKDYCDYGTCVALEELGYPRYHYDNGGELDKILRMVTLYNAQKWLREEKFLLIVVDRLLNGEYVFSVVDILNYSEEKNGTANSYEEALSEGVRASIKILQDEQKENN